jgi:hypothetical protein
MPSEFRVCFRRSVLCVLASFFGKKSVILVEKGTLLRTQLTFLDLE